RQTVAQQQTTRPQEETRKAERPTPPQPQQVMLEPPGAGEVKDTAPPAVAKIKDEKVSFETLPRAPHRRREVPPAAVPGRRQVDSSAETSTGANGPGLILEALSTR